MMAADSNIVTLLSLAFKVECLMECLKVFLISTNEGEVFTKPFAQVEHWENMKCIQDCYSIFKYRIYNLTFTSQMEGAVVVKYWLYALAKKTMT